jgi:hypothetical protein
MRREMDWRMSRVEDERRRALAAWIIAALCAAWPCLWASSAQAEGRAAPCDSFCNPVAAVQLTKQRGGYETSVILWDELNRRPAVPPPPTSGSNLGSDAATVRVGPVAAPNVVLVGVGR